MSATATGKVFHNEFRANKHGREAGTPWTAIFAVESNVEHTHHHTKKQAEAWLRERRKR